MKRSRVFILAACFCTAYFLSSCSNDESSNQPAQGFTLSTPSLFVPVGILRVPRGIAVDQNGNAWVADTRNNKLRKFSTSGIQTDSLTQVNQPQRIVYRKWTDDLLVIDNNYHIVRFTSSSSGPIPIATLNSFTVDTVGVLDPAVNRKRNMRIDVRELGDIDVASTSEIIYVSVRGNTQASVVMIANGRVKGYAASDASSIGGARMLAVDANGSVFSLFGFDRGPVSVPMLYMVSAFDLEGRSHIINEPTITADASGAAFDAQGNLYFVEPTLQKLAIISTATERTIARYDIPSIPGISLNGNSAQDVAVASDGTVYVVVNDSQNTIDGAGAVLKYRRLSQ